MAKVTPQELELLSGAASSIQTQINTQAAKVIKFTEATRATDLTISSAYTTFADLTDLTVTFTTSIPNEVILLHSCLTVSSASTATAVVFAYNVDAGTDVQYAVFNADGSINAEHTATLCRSITLASAGSHTIKLRGARTGGVNWTLKPGDGVCFLSVTQFG